MSAIPTPKRLSLGGGSSAGTPTAKGRQLMDDREAGAEFDKLMKTRPPSSLAYSIRPPSSLGRESTPDLAQSTSAIPSGTGRGGTIGNENLISKYGTAGLGVGSGDRSSPRTPVAINRRAPSAYLRQSVLANSQTPSRTSSASFKTPTPKPRTSLAPSTTTPMTTRSMSVSRPTTPVTDARASSRRAAPTLKREEFQAKVGDHVCVASLGNFEGIVRYIGPIEGKVGTFAGIELDAAFAGKGKNNGSVAGNQYFECAPNCGVYTAVEKLSRVQARAPSVASSLRSNSTTGRATPGIPSGRATPAYSLASSASGRATPFSEDDTDGLPHPLMQSSRVNQINRPAAEAPLTPRRLKAGLDTSKVTLQGKLTEGSRASRLAGMKANQLADSRAAAQRAIDATTDSLNGATPRAPRQSLSSSVAPSTPSRAVSMSAARMRGRPSLGGSAATPKPMLKSGRMSVTGRQSVSGRQSVAYEAMPTLTSPVKNGAINRSTGSTDLVEARARAEQQQMINVELLNKIEELQQQLADAKSGSKGDADKTKKELEQRIKDLTIASDFTSREASSTRIRLEALEAERDEVKRQLEATLGDYQGAQSKLVNAETSVEKLKREMQMQKERSEEEYELSMKTKRQEVKQAETQAEEAQRRLDNELLMKQEMIETAQQLQMVYEKKLGDAQHKQYQQDTIIRELEDKIAEALMKQNAPPLTPSQVAREAETAAEIENENLKAQVEHQQKKITGLEDQIDEMQVQLEKEAEVALKNNEKYLTNERKYKDDMSQQRQDMAGLREQISKGKDRIADLEHALKDQAKTLAGAQAEIESNRLDLAELENMRMAHGLLDLAQKERDGLKTEIAKLTASLKEVEAKSSAQMADADSELLSDLQQKHLRLESAHTELRAKYDDLQEKHKLGLPAMSSHGSLQSPGDTDTLTRSKLSAGASDLSKQIVGLKMMTDTLNDEIDELKEQIEATQSQLQASDAHNIELADANKQLETELQVLQDALDSSITPLEEAKKSASLNGSDNGHTSIDDDAAREISALKARVASLERERDNLLAAKASIEDSLQREIQELETLCEHKMWKEEDLEAHIKDLEERIKRAEATTSKGPARPSTSAAGPCEVCGGPYDFDQCPTCNGLDGNDSQTSPGSFQNGDSPLFSKSTNVLPLTKSSLAKEQMFCENCQTTSHRTDDCPLNDDTF